MFKLKNLLPLLLLWSSYSYAQKGSGCILGDCKNGIGTIIFNDGRTYGGQWLNGKIHGQGTMTWPNKRKYIGNFTAGQRSGYGTMTYTDGRKYVGEWRNDMRSGHGQESWLNGEKFIGEWTNDKKNGQGTFYYKDGSKYDGEWVANKKQGFGTMTWADGRKYIGEWANDMQNGNGILTSSTGEKYSGLWRDNKKHGQGTLTLVNGNIQTGEWKDDAFISKEKPVIANTTVNKIHFPAELKITNLALNDSIGNRNNILDANEKAEIRFTLTNQGKGDATNLLIEVQELDTLQSISYENHQTYTIIPAGAQKNIAIPISSKADLSTAEASFKIQIFEVHGFNAGPFYISFKTQEAAKVKLAVTNKNTTGCIVGNCNNGEGTMLFPDGRKYIGTWRDGKCNGKGIMIWPNGRKYDGLWNDNEPNGHGIEIGADGSKYEGDWVNGLKEGRGVYISAIGRKYSGSWKANKEEGEGLMIWPTGQKYLGNWKGGHRNGYGVMIWSNGEKYDGQWSSDKQNGRGVFYYTTKQVYNGEWKDGQRNGLGTMTFANGKKNIGEWKGDIFIQPEQLNHIDNAPKPKTPAVLEITNVFFVDSLGNSSNALSANSKGEIRFTISNQGKGDAYNMVIELHELNGIKGIIYDTKLTYAHLAAGKNTVIKIPIKSDANLVDGQTNFSIKVTEGNGYDADLFYANFKTQAIVK